MNEQERKNVNELKYVLVVIFIGFVIMAIALFKERATSPIKAPSRPPSDQTIPSAIEIQQMLINTGNPRYDPGIADGKIGAKTTKAWRNYSCDKMAIQIEPEYYGAKK